MSLKVLNVAGNRMKTLKDINNFERLESCDARCNSIEDVKDLTETVQSLRKLKQLFLQDNPVTKYYRYRENIIANSDSLECLDDKDISSVCRKFMKNFKIERHLQQTTKQSKMTLSDDITSSLNLPPAFKRSVTRAILQNSGPKLSVSVTSASGQLHPQIFPSWKSVSSIRGLRDSHFTPRPLWRSSSRGRPSLTFAAASENTIALPPI
ncbi:protein phosphatase 1 regulatory subunit 42 [Neodiprion pinetum]|uniref:protein phosphatase 1 regulatory subunit 42 n=1 Tax=Neodiprion pinetum TaxID=441929 RepID=UPI00371B17E5